MKLIRLGWRTTLVFQSYRFLRRIFLKSLDDFRMFLEFYLSDKNTSILILDNANEFSVILAPEHLRAGRGKAGDHFLKFRDDNKGAVSRFQFFGVCTFQRVNGQIGKSSMRKL